jgi:flagellar hook-associated protein 3 FlgL
VDLATLQKLAKNIYGFMVDLVNTKDGDRYVFGGSETLTQPLNDTGTLDSDISNLLAQWKSGAITTANLNSNLQDRDATVNPSAITDTIVGYSAALSAGNAGNVYARVEQNTEIDYTTLGNDQSFRDVLVTLSYFKNDDLGPISDTYIPPNTYPGVPDVQGAPGVTQQDMKDNFYAVFNHLTSMVSAAIDRADQLSENLANAQSRITDIQASQTDQKNVLLNTVSDVENTDTTELAVRINALSTQLNASLAVTANLQNLSLVNFLFNH